MAERKKKEEEVTVEKKFCTNCGKELEEGMVCDCKQNTSESVTMQSVMDTVKKVFNTILNVFKKPVKTIEEEMESKDNKTCVIILVALAISFAFLLMALIRSSLMTISFGGINFASSVSYFKVFIYGLLICALTSVIPMFAVFVTAKLFKNNTFSFKRAYRLYTLCSAPLVLVYLGMTIIALINVGFLNLVGLIAMLVINFFCFFNFIIGFNKEVSVKEDKKSWALTILVVICVVIEVIVLMIFVGTTASDQVKNPSLPNYNDVFNWD